MADGSVPTPGTPHRPDPSAFWARGAATDPWRDPNTAAIVRHTPPPVLPPTEPPLPPEPRGGRVGLGTIVLIAVLCSVFTGALSTAATLAITGGGGAQLADPKTERPLGDYQATIKKAMPSVVTIWAESDEGIGNGTGWVYSPEGYIVTNQHVAALAGGDGTEMSIQFSDGTMTEGEVVGAAKSTDIAVIKVDERDLDELPIADSDELNVGDPVVAIGAPLGLTGTVTDGIVSALDRPVVSGEGEGAESNTVMAGIQTDAAINPGNSGGPLLDAGGQLVGVNTSIYSFANDKGEAGSMGLGFAIPGNQATRVADELIDDGVATRPVLGTELEATPVGDTGAEVKTVASGTPAADAGIEDGDVITKFNDTVITDDVQLAALILKHAPGESVTITYERDGETTEATVDLGSAKDE